MHFLQTMPTGRDVKVKPERSKNKQGFPKILHFCYQNFCFSDFQLKKNFTIINWNFKWLLLVHFWARPFEVRNNFLGSFGRRKNCIDLIWFDLSVYYDLSSVQIQTCIIQFFLNHWIRIFVIILRNWLRWYWIKINILYKIKLAKIPYSKYLTMKTNSFGLKKRKIPCYFLS